MFSKIAVKYARIWLFDKTKKWILKKNSSTQKSAKFTKNITPRRTTRKRFDSKTKMSGRIYLLENILDHMMSIAM